MGRAVTLMVILSNGSPTLYWWIWPRFLVHGVANGCIGIALAAQILNIVFWLELVVPLPDLYSGSCWHQSDVRVHHIVWSARRSLYFEGELSGIFLIVHGRTLSDAQVCRSSQRGISIGPSTFCHVGPWSVICFHSRRCPIFASSRMDPMSWSFSFSILRAAGCQPAVVTNAIAHTCIMSACTSTLW
jgi:hypothetical protein